VNYIELAQRTRMECRVQGSGPVAVTGQSADYQRLLVWVNEAWQEIQRSNRFWRWMRRSASCPTVQGRQFYTAAHFGITEFGRWALDFDSGDTFRNYSNPEVTFDIGSSKVQLTDHQLANGDTANFFTTGSLPSGMSASTTYYVVNRTDNDFQVSATAGGAAITLSGAQSGTQTMSSGNVTSFLGLRTEVPMFPWDYDDWRDTYQFGANRNTYTRPDCLARAPDGSLAFGPITAAGYTVLGDYYRSPQVLTDAGDTPEMPEQFHMAIVYKAMQYFGASEAAPEVYDAGVLNFRKIYAELTQDQAPRMRLAGALA
jgi:hypothetical protein